MKTRSRGEKKTPRGARRDGRMRGGRRGARRDRRARRPGSGGSGGERARMHEGRLPPPLRPLLDGPRRRGEACAVSGPRHRHVRRWRGGESVRGSIYGRVAAALGIPASFSRRVGRRYRAAPRHHAGFFDPRPDRARGLRGDGACLPRRAPVVAGRRSGDCRACRGREAPSVVRATWVDGGLSRRRGGPSRRRCATRRRRAGAAKPARAACAARRGAGACALRGRSRHKETQEGVWRRDEGRERGRTAIGRNAQQGDWGQGPERPGPLPRGRCGEESERRAERAGGRKVGQGGWQRKRGKRGKERREDEREE